MAEEERASTSRALSAYAPPPRDGDLLHISGESDIGGRWRLDGGDPKYGEGAGGVEEDNEYPYQGGGEAVRVHIFLQSRRSVIIDLLCGDVGGYPPHGTGPRGFPGPGGAATDERLLRRRGDGSGIKPRQKRQESRRGLRQWGRASKKSEYGCAVHS